MLGALFVLLVAALASTASADSNLVKNGDFEQGLAGWSVFWSRAGGGGAELATDQPQQGQDMRFRLMGKRTGVSHNRILDVPAGAHLRTDRLDPGSRHWNRVAERHPL